MPKRSIPYYFLAGTNPYFPDWQATPATGLTAKRVFNAPPDLTEGNIDAIITAAGATRGSLEDPCPETGYTAIRRLQFVRKSGNTMTIGINSSNNLVSAANTISGILNTGGGANPEVVCIRLLGEEWANLNDEFNLAFDGTPGVTHRANTADSKQWFYSGTVEYQADYTNPIGGTVFQPVKSISNNEDAPATQLGSTWSTCVGNFENVFSCPRGRSRSNPLGHRRYILTFLVPENETGLDAGVTSEQIEMPVTDISGINACGQDLASLTGLYCIGYKGESYSRFHKVL